MAALTATGGSTTWVPLTKHSPSSSSSPLIPPKLFSLKETNQPRQQRRHKCCAASVSAIAMFGPGKRGAGLLERESDGVTALEPPPLHLSPSPASTEEVEEGGDTGRVRGRRGVGNGDSYKVLLIDDMRHTEKLVMKVLPQAIPSVTTEDASKLFHQSREVGFAVVIITVKEHAEFYAQMMVRGGLRSTIEPDSSTT